MSPVPRLKILPTNGEKVGRRGGSGLMSYASLGAHVWSASQELKPSSHTAVKIRWLADDLARQPNPPAGWGLVIDSVSRADPKLEATFGQLAEAWKRDTEFESSVPRMAMNRAYQQIIGLGPRAVPLILRELEREPDHWFWALTSITGEDPAHDEDTLAGATERWLEWGRSRRLLE